MTATELAFKSGDVTLYGTLSTPLANQKVPCIVMVHGSGPQDRTGNIKGFDTQIFSQLSEQLVAQGFATFCFDKRGCGKSEGSFILSGHDEIVADVIAAINLVKQSEHIDASKIFVLGHSEGACLAPRIANECDTVVGIVMLCASLRSFEEDGVKNAEVMNRDLDNMKGLKGKIARFFLYTKDPLKTMQDLRKKVESTDKAIIWLSFNRVGTKFYRDTFNYDTKAALAKCTVPILALGGEKDFQCHPDDTRQVASTTQASVTSHVFDNMDHMLRHQTGLPSLASYRTAASESIMPGVVEHTAKWLHEQVKESKEAAKEPASF